VFADKGLREVDTSPRALVISSDGTHMLIIMTRSHHARQDRFVGTLVYAKCVKEANKRTVICHADLRSDSVPRRLDHILSFLVGVVNGGDGLL